MNVLIENRKIICKRKIFSKEIATTELEKSLSQIRAQFCSSRTIQTNCIKKQAESTSG